MISYDNNFAYYDVLPKNLQNGKNRRIIKCKLVDNEYVDEKCHEVINYAKDNYGYIVIQIDLKTIKFHRYVYEMFNEKIVNDNLVRHMCNNRSCCNPRHLKQGTPQDNMDDMVSCERFKSQSGSKNNMSKLTEKDVYEIKHLLKFTKIKQKEIGNMYKVSRSTIANISSGNQWKHVLI